jgi:hypothetical protein
MSELEQVLREEQFQPTREWAVVDNFTQEVVSGPFKSRVRASRKADKMDLEYGAVRYSVKEWR